MNVAEQQEIVALRRQLAEQKEIQRGLEDYLAKVLAEFEALEDELKSEKVWAL